MLKRLALLFLALVALLVGCGGDGSSVTVVSNSGTGTVAVVVVDGPTDDFLHVFATVTEVELIGAQGHFTLFEGRRVIDLLTMRDDARLLSLGREVPAGDWSKIRLHVEDVELVLPDGESVHPKVGGNGKIDLNPRAPISVRSGELVFVQLDLDAQKSIHVVETGSERFVFRPVVFVDLFAVRPDRLVRLEGRIQELDAAGGTLLVCGTHLVFRPGDKLDPSSRSRCIDARVGADTAIFGDDGQPIALGDLAVGDTIAALGRFRVDTGEALVFDAAWIQQGGFAAGVSVSGEIVNGVSGDEFAIAPDPGSPVDEDELTVRLVPGAKLWNRAGTPVAPSALVPGLRVRVFGVLAGTDPERLDASLVFVRELSDRERIHGTITRAFDSAAGTIAVQVATATSVGPVCVAFAAGDDVFRITEQGDGLISERITPNELKVGEVVDVFGVPATPCFDAATLISFGVGGG